MRHSSAGLARPAIGRTAEPPAQATGPRAGARDQEGVAPLHGVMTGLANLVNEQLGRLTMGPQATRFLRHLERTTFGNAGLHRRAGRSDPGLWCPYDHAAWAEALGLSSSALAHLRTRLVESGIVWYTPDPERRGRGALGWNFDFASWKPLPWGGARPGAGRPRASAPSSTRAASAAPVRPVSPSPVVALAADAEVPAAGPSPAASPSTPIGARHPIQGGNGEDGAEPAGKIKTSTGRIQGVNERESGRQRPRIEASTTSQPKPGRHPGAARRAGGESPKKENNQSRRTDADASAVARTPRAAPRVPISRSPPAAPPEGCPSPPRAHPPPLPYETLRSYWLRVYREAGGARGQEARYVVHAAARALLNMGHERADYVLLGQLRQAAGTWATTLHWILDCAGRELADPRTYLRAIAARERAGADAQNRPRRLPGRSRATTPRASRWADSAGDTPTRAGRDGPGRMPVADARLTAHAGASEGDAGAHAAIPSLSHEGEGAAAERALGAAGGPYEPMRHLWFLARQNLRAELTPAQYGSWLADTELVRAADGSLVVVTRTNFAADLIARRWGDRIRWLLGQITGRDQALAVAVRRPGAVDGG
jgi:hypothetical protein